MFELDPFIQRALLGGMGIALMTGPLGCFIVWQRMAYFGDALSHSALLGIALGIVLSLNINLGIILVCILFASLIILLQKQKMLATDTLLGILSHSALALGIVTFSFFPAIRLDLFAYLFGDILAINQIDIIWIYTGALITLLVIYKLWHSLLLITIDEDLAKAEGVPTNVIQVAFMLILAIVIAVAIHIVGVLLITSLLVIPAASARHFARTPEQMAFFASILGMLAVVLGIATSAQWDTPSGPSIVVSATSLFIVTYLMRRLTH